MYIHVCHMELHVLYSVRICNVYTRLFTVQCFACGFQAFERNAILENELDEKQRLAEMCQRLKDEVKGQ